MPRVIVALLLIQAACSTPGTSKNANATAPNEHPIYAALPLRNLTADAQIADELSNRIEVALESRGAGFVGADELDRVLRERRIRYTDSLSLDAAHAIGAATGAKHALLGTLIAVERTPTPRLSLALRVIDLASGEREQSIVVALDGDEFKGALGLGAIRDVDELTREVVARVVEGFDEHALPIRDAADRAGLAAVRPSDVLSRFVTDEFSRSAPSRLTIMPFSNRTRRADVGALFSEVVAHQWFKGAGVQIVEPAELRAALTREKIRSIESIDLEVLARIASSLGTRYVVMGSIDRFDDEVFVDDQRFPEIEVSLRVIDVDSRRIVAAATLRRRGDRYRGFLCLHAVHDTVELASRTARELIASIAPIIG